MKPLSAPALLALALAFALSAGCSRTPTAADEPHKHEHHPPHGGTPVVLGDETYHLELVLDARAGTLQAYVLDGEMEDFIRSAVPSIEIDATVNGATVPLVLAAVPNTATGETVGDTSLFEGRADWLRTAKEFDAVLRTITVRGTTFTDVKFNFPKGNDTDG
jgi:hypothetical protein